MSYELFQVTQGAIIKNSEGAILLLEIENDLWFLPGGHVDRNEDWEMALRRELKEELGLTDFKIKKIVDIAAWPEKDRPYSVYAVTFLVEAPDFKEPKLSNEHTKYAWVAPDELDKYKFWDEVLKTRVRKGFQDGSFI